MGGKLSGVVPFRKILLVTTLFEKLRKVSAAEELGQHNRGWGEAEVVKVSTEDASNLVG